MHVMRHCDALQWWQAQSNQEASEGILKRGQRGKTDGPAQAPLPPAQGTPASCQALFPHCQTSGEGTCLPMLPAVFFGFLRCAPYQEVQKSFSI